MARRFREAVLEGWLADYDPPHILKTELSTNGIHYARGETVAVYDSVTGEITNSKLLADELDFDVDDFNRSVITENFNRVGEAISHFKNEQTPNIVVTVDLLTTGVDIPKITTLIFIRRVKSRILFEQMLGRATRLCHEINKTHFQIYDAVGVYEIFKDVTTMKPVAVNPSETFLTLLDSLKNSADAMQIQNLVDQTTAKLQRLNPKLTRENLSHFSNLTGGSSFVISEHSDELIEHSRIPIADLPRDYLDEFAEFLRTHQNEITALKIVCTSPKDLTRADLQSLITQLEVEGFSVNSLNRAVSKMTNAEIAAELRWLDRIEKYLLNETVINRATFDEATAFKSQGGFARIDKVFRGNLANVIDELNDYLYDDGGGAA